MTWTTAAAVEEEEGEVEEGMFATVTMTAVGRWSGTAAAAVGGSAATTSAAAAAAGGTGSTAMATAAAAVVVPRVGMTATWCGPRPATATDFEGVLWSLSV